MQHPLFLLLRHQREGEEPIQGPGVTGEFLADHFFHGQGVFRQVCIPAGNDTDLGGENIVGQPDYRGHAQGKGLGIVAAVQVQGSDDPYGIR